MLIPNPMHIEELMKILNTSSYPEHMQMKLVSIELDRAVLELNVSKCHFQPFGIVHGGVLATLVDSATFWAVYMRLSEDTWLVNIDLKLNYLKPVKTKGEPLIAKGYSIRSGEKISYAESKIVNMHGDLIAHGTSTLMTLPGKALKTKTEKFTKKYCSK